MCKPSKVYNLLCLPTSGVFIPFIISKTSLSLLDRVRGSANDAHRTVQDPVSGGKPTNIFYILLAADELIVAVKLVIWTADALAMLR